VKIDRIANDSAAYWTIVLKCPGQIRSKVTNHQSPKYPYLRGYRGRRIQRRLRKC